MVTYDPRNMDWPEYCALMTELFSNNSLNVVDEKDWKEWVNAISNIGNICQSGIPDARLFDNWKDWAEQMVGIMSLQP